MGERSDNIGKNILEDIAVSKKLTKIDIVKGIMQKYGVRYGLKFTAAKKIVQDILDQIIGALKAEDIVELRNFGVFIVVQRKARKARNPRSNVEVFLPQRKVVKFKPGKIMEDEITLVSMGRKKSEEEKRP